MVVVPLPRRERYLEEGDREMMWGQGAENWLENVQTVTSRKPLESECVKKLETVDQVKCC